MLKIKAILTSSILLILCKDGMQKVVDQPSQHASPPLSSTANQQRNSNTTQTSAMRCQIEEYSRSNIKTISRPRYTSSSLKCRNGTLVGEKINLQGSPQHLKSITFENAVVPALPKGLFSSFADFTQLHQLYLNESHIATVEAGAFDGLNVLEELYLQGNLITKLCAKIFTLPHLKVLNLKGNRLKFVEESTFSELGYLYELDLSCNSIDNLLQNVFLGLNHIGHINLAENMLTNVFVAFPNSTTSVNLTFNHLKEIDFAAFPVYLEKIYLGNNHIDHLQNIAKHSNLVYLSAENNNISTLKTFPSEFMYLNLSNNAIAELDDFVFNQTAKLITLDLSSNSIENINQNAFFQMVKLKQLFLQNNQLKNLPLGCFIRLIDLQLLNLSSNQIAEFKFETFAGLENLEHLDISSNKVSSLYNNSFYALKSLQLLDISGNILISWDANYILTYANNLKSIRLDQNLWYCNSLFNILAAFIENGVNVSKGFETSKESVYGIACAHKNFNNTNYQSWYLNESLKELQRISEDLKGVKTFIGMSLKKYAFNKYGNDSKTTSKPIDGSVLTNITQELFLIKRLLQNYSNTDYHRTQQDFAQYLESIFITSSMYKYMNGDYLHSKLFRDLSKYSQTALYVKLSNISSQIQVLGDHWKNHKNSDAFNNASFSQYNYLAYQNNEDIALKLSQIQNAVAILAVVIIVMFFIFLLLILARKVSALCYYTQNGIIRKGSINSASSTEIELI